MRSMTILDRLSSQVGDRSAAGNLAVAGACLVDPRLLAEIGSGLASENAALAGDCAEVMTEVARTRSELVAPYVDSLTPLLSHKNTRVRWEATHALAFITHLVGPRVGELLPQLGLIIRTDKSTIVRDYAVDAVGNYAGTGSPAARAAYPILQEALAAWDGKHAGHALAGLTNVAVQVPDLRAELRSCAEPFLGDRRAVVQRAAKALLKKAAP